MSLWEKFKSGFGEGISSASEKAADWFKTGADAVKEGTGKASEKIAYGSKLAKLKYEYRNIHKAIEKEFTELGGKVYNLFCENKVVDLEKDAKENIKRLNSLENDLKNKEKEIEELPRVFGKESIDRRSIDDLKKDLEAGGGTIEQIVIEDKSPFLGKKLKEIQLPEDALVGTIIRGEEVIIPDGETVFQASDKVTLLGKKEDVDKTIEQMKPGRSALPE
jgi:K+/H+ antiporter YhaU regulatory subunit KhtT